MNTYAQLTKHLGTRDMCMLPTLRATALWRLHDGSITVEYHGTTVVIAHQDNTFTLSNGGYRTVTTKARINKFSSASVFQLNGEWYLRQVVDGQPRSPVMFADGVRVDAKGLVCS